MSKTNRPAPRELGAVGARIASSAQRSRGNSWRLDLRLYLGDNEEAWLQADTPHGSQAIRGIDDDDLLEQVQALMAAVRRRDRP